LFVLKLPVFMQAPRRLVHVDWHFASQMPPPRGRRHFEYASEQELCAEASIDPSINAKATNIHFIEISPAKS
jgi:hypothetical protein